MELRELIEKVLKQTEEKREGKAQKSKYEFELDEYVLIDLNPENNIMLRNIKIEIYKENLQTILTAKVYCKLQKLYTYIGNIIIYLNFSDKRYWADIFIYPEEKAPFKEKTMRSILRTASRKAVKYLRGIFLQIDPSFG